MQKDQTLHVPHRRPHFLSDQSRSIRLMLWIISLLLLCAGLQAQETDASRPLWRTLQPGPHAVGYRLLYNSDGAPSQNDRVVRIALWYPAQTKSGSEPMVFGDYLKIQPEMNPDPELERWMRARDTESLGRQFFDDKADSHQAALMAAPIPVMARAQVAEGSFPLIVHSLGRNGHQFQHTILWEYLASHGYAVVSVAQYGKNLKDPTMAFSVKDLAYQLQDMEQAVANLVQMPFIDGERIGLLGHSSGAVVALWHTAVESRVKAVVGLDGSVNRLENQKVLRGGLKDKRITKPFLNICRWPHDEYYDGWTPFLTEEITRVGYARAIHFDFQNWPAYQAFAGATEPSSMAIRPVSEAETVFVSTAQFTRLFLDAHLKSDPDAAATIRNAAQIASISQGLATLHLATRD